MTAGTHKRFIMGQEIDFPDGGLWTHKKTGGRYVVLFPAMIEATMEPAVCYASASSGMIWVRPVKEFLDGRFE